MPGGETEGTIVKEKDRAWKDARNDYLLERALERKIAWKLFWAITLLGLGWKFFSVEVYD
jgi:hypothetical protein